MNGIKPYWQDNGTRLINGDCVEVMAAMDADSLDAIVTDPPYGLEFMGQEWDRLQGYTTDINFKGFKLPRQRKRNVKCPECEKYVYDHPGRRCVCGGVRRFQQNTMQAWHHRWAVEALRVLKPGGHLLAFGGTRTSHRLVCALEDAGFEIRDTVMWVYGSGFPKSLDVSKAIDRAAGVERDVVGSKVGQPGYSQRANDTDKHNRSAYGQFTDAESECSITAPATEAAKQWDGWGTALKPSFEPIVLCRKPLSEGTVAANVLKWGTGALNIDACRVGTNGEVPKPGGKIRSKRGKFESLKDDGYSLIDAPEPHLKGRWPANLIHDGSDEVLSLFPETKSGDLLPHHRSRGIPGIALSGSIDGSLNSVHGASYGDSGSAARFFYVAKAAQNERFVLLCCDCETPSVSASLDPKDLFYGILGTLTSAIIPVTDARRYAGQVCAECGVKVKTEGHPTQKPLDLIRYLIRLIVPPDGLVLDPFCGSGTTLKAASLEGVRSIGIEKNGLYCDMAIVRLET